MSFASLLTKFKDLRAIVVGDLMLDEYIVGRATRISPEAPVMVIRQSSSSSVPGGAANVAHNLRALGARTAVAGVVGCDTAGRALGELLDLEGGALLVRDPSRATTRKTRILADHAHQVLRIDHEEDGPISTKVESEMISRVTAAIDNCDVVILSDYLKGSLTENVVRSIIDAAVKAGIPVVANPKPRTLDQYRGASLVSLNRSEAADALGLWQEIADVDALRCAAELRNRLRSDAVLITLGESGMAIATDAEFLVQAPRVEVYDTAGAGDTVIATVALGIASSGLARDVFSLAAATAAAVVRKVGVAAPSKEDLEEIATLG